MRCTSSLPAPSTLRHLCLARTVPGRGNKTAQLPVGRSGVAPAWKGDQPHPGKEKNNCTRHRIKLETKRKKKGEGHTRHAGQIKVNFQRHGQTGTNGGAAGSSAGIVFCLYAVRRPRTEEGEKHTNDTNERGTTRRREGKEQTQKTMRTPSMSWVTIFLVPGGMTPRMACC